MENFLTHFNLAEAFMQAVMMGFGCILLLIGLVMVWGDLHWYINGKSAPAEVVGVREKKGIYFNVYRYMHPDTGETIEATSSSGSSLKAGRETGHRETIWFMENDRQNVTARGFPWLIPFGLAFLTGAFFMLRVAVSNIENMPWVVFLFVIFFIVPLVRKIKSVIIPKEQRLSKEDWQAKRRQERAQERENMAVQRMEDITAPDNTVEGKMKAAQGYLTGALVLLLIGAGLCFGGYKTGSTVYELEAFGLRAQGEVIDLDARHSDDGTTWAAIVRFTDGSGRDITFTDSFSSSPAAYDEGEMVQVMYLQDSPKSSAAIDRGWVNWVLPGILSAIGVLLLYASLKLFIKRRQAQVL